MNLPESWNSRRMTGDYSHREVHATVPTLIISVSQVLQIMDMCPYKILTTVDSKIQIVYRNLQDKNCIVIHQIMQTKLSYYY